MFDTLRTHPKETDFQDAVGAGWSSVADCFEREYAPSGSIEGGEFLDHLGSDLRKEISAPRMDRPLVSLTGSVAEPSCVGCA
jgi:hypothetical protein